jgi:cytoskeletal protein CcmA (bactofilin family)
MMDNSGFRSAVDPIDGAGRKGGRESIIDQDCFFEGTFRTPGNMRIEGGYQGAIECRGTLLIAETGQVNARVVAGNLIVAGQFSGEVQCESRFELLKTGRASGSVAAATTVVHDGAHFDGEIRMGGREASVADSRTPPASIQPTQAPAQNAEPAEPPRPAASSRRRAVAEPDADSAAPQTEVAPDSAEDGPQSPRANGRSQSTAAREVLPNRTGEPLS